MTPTTIRHISPAGEGGIASVEGGTLKPYRIELLDEEGGGVWEHVIHCEDDGDAIDRTGRIAHPYAMRLLEGDRYVARFEPGRGRRCRR